MPDRSNIATCFAVTVLLVAKSATSFAAPTFKQQVDYCKSGLGISNVSFPAVSCMGKDTVRTDTHERLGYLRLSNSVDAVFHCAGVDEGTRKMDGTMEMIVHNRSTGKTCFFNRSDDATVSVDFPSLDAANASSRWKRPPPGGIPDDCIACHKNGGPYFMGPDSFQAMARFGLINNGHDTTQQRYSILNADSAEEAEENERKMGNIHADKTVNGQVQHQTCGASCHNFIITDHAPGNPLSFLDGIVSGMVDEGLMAPDEADNDFRWINRDTAGSSGDWESLSGVRDAYPHFHCTNPTKIEAHEVGSSRVFKSPGGFTQKINTFNLRDGLICLNADQGSLVVAGTTVQLKCYDYQVRFLCSYSTRDSETEQWSSWQNTDTNDVDGDREMTANMSNVCGGSKPLAIQAKYQLPGVHPTSITVNGPADRLAEFSPTKGLVCKNDDQPNGGKCSNYVVRFTCP